ncbi:MAG: hypothetical protein QOE33_9 [Acidobacteriota bacterium]|nr:hypothetical protein [Acidobacteriota bacterium]
METGVEFPLTVTFEDGSTERYESVESLEQDLEDFDSDVDVQCRVADGRGRAVRLKVKMLEVKEASLIDHDRPS